MRPSQSKPFQGIIKVNDAFILTKYANVKNCSMFCLEFKGNHAKIDGFKITKTLILNFYNHQFWNFDPFQVEKILET